MYSLEGGIPKLFEILSSDGVARFGQGNQLKDYQRPTLCVPLRKTKKKKKKKKSPTGSW